VDRSEIEARVDQLRAQHPGREEFVAAIGGLAESLDPGEREVLGRVLLERQPETGGFDVISQRIERGGWMKRTMRKVEDSERKYRKP
jgi:hypothetical protein